MQAERYQNAMLGLAVGDAFGMPYETGPRGSFDIYSDARDGCGGYAMQGYAKGMPAHWYAADLPAGTWTDDTAMVLAEMESIARLGRIDLNDLMDNFCRWLFEGAFSAHGVAIGQGRRTVAALTNYRNGAPPLQCGGTEPASNGNGSLMRMLPFVFTEALLASSGVTVRDLSALTHAHACATTACELYVAFARQLLQGADKRAILPALGDLPAPFDRLRTLETLPASAIKSTGYVVDSLEAALWCFLTTDSYEDCVMTAINLGGDTDTIAAIAGSLAGLRHAVPQRWIDQLARKDDILHACEAFVAAIA